MALRAGGARHGWLPLVVAFALSHAAAAQSPADGALAGRLLSATGAPMPYTMVIAIDSETGVAQRATTGARGEFIVTRLPPGDYSLAVADSSIALPLPGQYVVHLGEVTEVEAHMAVTTVVPTLPVVAPPELSLLPLQDGDWRALLTNSSAATNVGDSGDAAELSARGIDPSQNSGRMDGASAIEDFSGTLAGAGSPSDVDMGAEDGTGRSSGPGTGTRSLSDDGRRTGSSNAFAVSAVREFRMTAQSEAVEYGSALYGHGAGALVTSVSRSGGTRLHGMAMYTVRSSAWAASDPFSLATSYNNGAVTSEYVKPRDLQQQFAARIGGPLLTHSPDRAGEDIASRLSYLLAFERQTRDDPAVSSPRSPDFYRLTAIQTALLANRGVSASATGRALSYLSSLTGTVPRSAGQTIEFGRLDWLRTASTRTILEYNHVRWSDPQGAHSGAVVNRGAASFGSSNGAVDAAVARVLLFPAPRVNNELRLQYSHELHYDTPQQPLPQEPAVGPGGFAPQVSIGPDEFLFGTPASLGRNAYPDERRLEAADVVAWVHGSHLFQFGGDFSALRDFTNSLSNVEGSFTYDSGTTAGHAGGLVDWITDYTYGVNAYPNGACPSIYAARHDFCFRSYSQSFGQQSLTWHTREWAAFLQDDWRTTRTLTMHIGVRYESQALPAPQQPNKGLDAVFGKFASTSEYPQDGNNLGPRIGVAWQPLGAGRGTILIGYGLYFGRVPGATVRTALLDTALPASTTRIRITPTTETTCPQNPQVGFGYPCSFLTAPSGVAAQSTSAVLFSRGFRLPAVQQGTLSIERPVGWGIVASAGYVMNLDRQLAASADINIAPSTGFGGFQLQGGTGLPGARNGEFFYVPLYTARVSSAFGPVTAILSNANATYNAVTLEARRGLGGRAGLGGTGRGLEFRVAWTWSKALDFAPETGAVPRSNSQFDPFTNRYDKALSALNLSHRVVATAVWSPRPIETVTLLRNVLDGWALAGIFSESSGRPYSYTIFGGARLAGGHESINGSGGSTVLPSSGRNTLRLPDTADFNLRLTRTFRLSETFRVHATADAFNLINKVNYSGVTQRAYLVGTPGTGGAAAGITPLVFQDAATIAAEGLNTLPFGAFTDAGAGGARQRRIQLGLRFEF